MKILHVLMSARAEGTVRLALDWLDEPSMEQGVLVLHNHPDDLAAALKSRAGFWEAAGSLPTGWSKYAWIMSAVAASCRRNRPDMVLCWTNGLAPWVLGGAHRAGVRRLITHAGNPPTTSLKGRVHTLLGSWAVRAWGGRMVCCSHYVADRYRASLGMAQSIIRVAYNCAPVDTVARIAAEQPPGTAGLRLRLIMVATLEAHKDHATLIKSMVRVREAVTEVELNLVGEGSLQEPLVALAQQEGVADVINFLGSRTDVPALLGQSDVFVFSTTREEGLGIVLIEALAAGLPVIASDVPACREFLDHGRWGDLVPAGDPDRLAAAIIARRETAGTRECGEARRAYLEGFRPAAMMAAYGKFVT